MGTGTVGSQQTVGRADQAIEAEGERHRRGGCEDGDLPGVSVMVAEVIPAFAVSPTQAVQYINTLFRHLRRARTASLSRLATYRPEKNSLSDRMPREQNNAASRA